MFAKLLILYSLLKILFYPVKLFCHPVQYGFSIICIEPFNFSVEESPQCCQGMTEPNLTWGPMEGHFPMAKGYLTCPPCFPL